MVKLLFLLVSVSTQQPIIVRMDTSFQNQSVCELSLYEEANKLMRAVEAQFGKDAFIIKDHVCQVQGEPT